MRSKSLFVLRRGGQQHTWLSALKYKMSMNDASESVKPIITEHAIRIFSLSGVSDLNIHFLETKYVSQDKKMAATEPTNQRKSGGAVILNKQL